MSRRMVGGNGTAGLWPARGQDGRGPGKGPLP
jgi:hypothetical protein